MELSVLSVDYMGAETVLGYMTWHQDFDLALACISCILCLVIAGFMVNWSWRLRRSRSRLRPLVASLVLFKLSLAWWAAGNVWAMWYTFDFPPLATLPPRLMIFAAAIMQASVIWWMLQPARDEGMVQKVLIVEDERLAARALTRALRQLGYSCDHVSKGSDALDLMARCNYLAAFLDIMLPDMSGLEVARLASGTPLIAMSGGMEVMDKALLQSVGFIASLPKPYRIHELAEIMRTVAPIGAGPPEASGD